MLTYVQTSFSIRIRIESLATARLWLASQAHNVFQYPHSDRITCNRAPVDLYDDSGASFSIRIEGCSKE